MKFYYHEDLENPENIYSVLPILSTDEKKNLSLAIQKLAMDVHSDTDFDKAAETLKDNLCDFLMDCCCTTEKDSFFDFVKDIIEIVLVFDLVKDRMVRILEDAVYQKF